MTRPRAPEPLPVQFDRRRIYVLPTRFGLFYSVLTATMALGALNYNNNPALMLALLLAGTGLASLVAAQLQLAGMSVVAVDAEPVPAGQPMTLRVHVQAPPGRTRIGLEVGSDDGYATSGQLDLADQRGEGDIVVETRRRGWLDLPRLRISTTRPLGLARAWAHVWPETPALVYAAPERDGPPLPEGRGDGARARPEAAGEDIHQLRDYRRGDARRAIAWKASAHRQGLLVREYERPLGMEVLLQWSSVAGLTTERRIARLAHWIDLAEREGRRYRLSLPGQPDLGPDRGTLHRHACQRALALMPHG